jgi:hypothetical protein
MALTATLVMDERDRIWASLDSVYLLAEGKGTAFEDGCPTPFVHLYDVSADNPKDFTFPATRKALSTFAGVTEVGLVDFHAEGARRLGITVPSKAQGEALVAHIKAHMKDEDPRLICYEPKDPRKIEVRPKGN